MRTHIAPVSGYRLDLGGGLAGELHADGGLSLEAGSGQAADLTPEQTDQLFALLRLGGQVRARARRQRAAECYVERHKEI